MISPPDQVSGRIRKKQKADFSPESGWDKLPQNGPGAGQAQRD
jgi:hypothetical protein